jgi:hypothetical protein
VHGVAAWFTTKLCPAIVSVAVNAVLDVFAGAWKVTLPVPCDPLEVIVNQVLLGSGVELQGQALAVETVTVPLPPMFGTVATVDPKV